MGYWRGLFYLWIAASITWIGGWTIAVFQEELSEGKSGYIYSARKETGELVEFSPDHQQWSRLKKRDDLILVALPSGAQTVVRRDWSESERNERAAAIWQKLKQRKTNQKRERKAFFVSMMTIPTAVFSIGLLVYWLRRGR